MKRCFLRLRWCAALVLLAAGATAWSVAARAGLAPAAGRFLVATRTQQGFFAQSVILLIAYGPGGAVGIVVNHPTKVALAEVLPDPGLLRGRSDLLYLGGPVALDDLTMLIRSRNAPAKSIRVFTGVYASGSLTTLRAAVGQKLTSASFRAYAGYAGWAPGQLDSELEQGAWIVARADADEVFATAPEKLWDTLAPQGDVILVQAAPWDPGFQNRRYRRISPPAAAILSAATD